MIGRRDGWTPWLWLLGLLNLANGVWMLASAETWYYELPAAVPDFGPLNAHMIHDIGAVYVVLGAALVGAARTPAYRFPLVGVVALFSLLHAAGHVVDLALGRIEPAHWLIDFPGVFLPAIVFTALAVHFGRAGPGQR